MSTVERESVIKAHKDKAANVGDVSEKQRLKHLRLQNALKANTNRANRAKTFSSGDRKSEELRRGRFGSFTENTNVSTVMTKTAKYFWDYNTVEAVLLACAILVCVGGVMFESDRFKDNTDTTWQRDIVTYFVLFVIGFSIFYFLVVLISELFSASTKQALPNWMLKCFGMKYNVNKDTTSIHDKMDNDDDLEMSDMGTAAGVVPSVLLTLENAKVMEKSKELDIALKQLERKSFHQTLLEKELYKTKVDETRDRRLLEVKDSVGVVLHRGTRLNSRISESKSFNRSKTTKYEYSADEDLLSDSDQNSKVIKNDVTSEKKEAHE